MRILFGIQLTGNGHINRSKRLISELRKRGHEVDVVVSGGGNSLDYTVLRLIIGIINFVNFSVYNTGLLVNILKKV